MARSSTNERPLAVPAWLRLAAAYAWRLLLLGALVVAAVAIITRLWVVFLAVIVAILLSSVLVPPVDALCRRGVPRLLATWIVFGALLGGLVGAVVFAGERVWREFDDVQASGSAAIDRVESWLTDGPLHLSHAQFQEVRDGASRALHQGDVVGGAIGGASLAIEIVAGSLVALVLAFFFTKDGGSIVRGLLSVLPAERSAVVDEAARRCWHNLRRFLLGSTVDGAVEATLKAILLLVLGVPLVLPLAFLTFLGGYLPLIGAIAAGSVSASVALVAVGPGTALLVLAGSVVIQNVEGHLLQPLIMGRAVRVHPALILITVSAFGLMWGIVGAFLAVPALTVARTLLTFRREHAGA